MTKQISSFCSSAAILNWGWFARGEMRLSCMGRDSHRLSLSLFVVVRQSWAKVVVVRLWCHLVATWCSMGDERWVRFLDFSFGDWVDFILFLILNISIFLNYKSIGFVIRFAQTESNNKPEWISNFILFGFQG